MAYKDFGKDFDGLLQGTPNHSSTTLHIDGQTVELPDASFVRDAEMTRDGMDLVLEVLMRRDIRHVRAVAVGVELQHAHAHRVAVVFATVDRLGRWAKPPTDRKP